MDDEDKPVTQRLLVMTLLDCIPGEAKPLPHETQRTPITIITFSNGGEIEQPLMLTIPDTKKLVVKLLESLARHGDEKAEMLVNRYFTPPEKSDDDG
jgi:hypothetical protein